MGEDIALGEIAHIVAQSPNGPRGTKRPPGGSVDGQDNLILLCQDHHTAIDRQPQHFPVAQLLQWKSDHEQWVRDQLSPREEFVGIETPGESIEETVYSTLLSVQHLPGYVHVADCDLTEAAVQEGIEYAGLADAIVAPFIVRGKKLMTFCDLKEENNPFKLVVDPYSAETKYATSMVG